MVKRRGKTSHDETADQIHELETQLKRALADYQNLQRRVEEERHAISKFANQVLLLELLPIIEHLEQIVQHAPDTEKGSSWFAPLQISVKQLQDIMKQEGIEEINPVDGIFDPQQHEAVDMVEGDEDNKIVAVLSKGYKLRDKVIKAAHVRVSKKAAEAKE